MYLEFVISLMLTQYKAQEPHKLEGYCIVFCEHKERAKSSWGYARKILANSQLEEVKIVHLLVFQIAINFRRNQKCNPKQETRNPYSYSKYQKGDCEPDPNLTSWLQSHSYYRNMASLSLVYIYFHGNCSYKLSSLAPL